MARKSAINAVADAMLAALNVASLRAWASGGVYRGRPNAQTPPFVSIGPNSETPDDCFGTHYGAVVTVPIHAITSGQDADGDDRCADILNQIITLLDEPSVLTVTGWTVQNVRWVGTQISGDENLLLLTGDPTGIDGVATFEIQVKAV
jgi:hypothetical protein